MKIGTLVHVAFLLEGNLETLGGFHSSMAALIDILGNELVWDIDSGIGRRIRGRYASKDGGDQLMDGLESLCEKYGVPTIDLQHFTPSAEAVRLVPLALALRFHVLPLSRVGCVLTAVVQNPLELTAIQSVMFATGLRVEIVVAPLESIIEHTPRFYGLDAIPSEDNVDLIVTDADEDAEIEIIELPEEGCDALFSSALEDNTAINSTAPSFVACVRRLMLTTHPKTQPS